MRRIEKSATQLARSFYHERHREQDNARSRKYYYEHKEKWVKYRRKYKESLTKKHES